MYWPIGAPKVFEQSFLGLSSSISHDGLDKDRDEATGDGALEPKNDVSKHDEHIVAVDASRNGHLFATITRQTLTVWQSRPTAVLTSVIRSAKSIKTYGPNVSLLIRPDAAIIVVHTALGYLITYALSDTSDGQVYRLLFDDGGRRVAKRRSGNASKSYGAREKGTLLEGGGYIQEVGLRFRMVIKLDAGISKALALDDELIIATEKPAALQCIRWVPDRNGSQTSTELLSRMNWLQEDETLLDMIHERPMSLFAWIMGSGKAYAVQRLVAGQRDAKNPKALFKGHEFHNPATEKEHARKAAINSKFSLIAIGCEDGAIMIYSVRDYSGGINFLNRITIPTSPTSSGNLTTLNYSPDGHCLFAGYEHGWATWSVYGQLGGTSFGADLSLARDHHDYWLTGVQGAFWKGGGSDIVVLGNDSNRLYGLEFARSAIVGCFSPANISKGLLQTSDGFMIYQGHDMPDLSTISGNISLWHHVQAPPQYLADQWPTRASVISSDGRYLAVAGQRGLAHYSVSSSRWKTFEDEAMQNEFFIRGGMCWHQHVLIAAVESSSAYELRLYSRELDLDNSKVLHVTSLSAPAVHIAPSGDDSLLVYTYENILDHYVIVASKKSMQLLKVGQIALHGIIRAPPRVRAVSWIVPDHQLQNGDPSQDVAVASVMFLVDGKLVLLQPSTNEDGGLKYEMRLIAQNVEYYTLARDNPLAYTALIEDLRGETHLDESHGDSDAEQNLRDSLWVFDGEHVKLWTDVHDLVTPAAAEYNKEVPAPIMIPLDFYPLTPLLNKGILFGVEAELLQRRDSSFSTFQTVARTTLFLPSVLRHHLAQYDSPAALHLSHRYQDLPYFPHALEILLHNVLDEEVENTPHPDNSLLPGVLSFLSTFPEYLDIVVQCTRKTELRSWRTLFAHLPPPQELFETSLANGSLKTAGGYLLVLHNLSEIESTSPQVIRLLRAARAEQDWELCKELARFLMALDESGATLKEALELMDLSSPMDSKSADMTAETNGISAQSRNGLRIIDAGDTANGT